MAVDLETTVAILTDGPECPGSVNEYWHQELGNLWTEPTFISYRDGQIPDNACTEDITDPDEVADNAFFCSADDTISYSEDLLDKLYEEGGPYLPVVVLEHELGHRANYIARSVGVISRSEENQADCDAGLTTAWARTYHRLPFSDVLKSAGLLYTLGDTRNFGDEIALSPDAHGSPSQRVIAFSRGYAQNSVKVCRALGTSETGSVAGP
jgi:predicted metalloprotease